ncbi:alpha-2-macroglobulin family protein [Maridesulfovibrio frigidus]|uniref:alpha-2-macroglobulin family protein n=1 Tax=Maridesulfovibrio frigidus TaxID=340956 RepID=UPI0004E24C1C|nr:MG2 domain-containing protein [Maridesulfovibrio frigidus]
MDRGPSPFRDKKNVLIGLLLMLCIIQASALLKNKHESVSNRMEAGENVVITDVSLDSQGYSQLLIAFDRPIGPLAVSTVLKTPPAKITPEVKGEWRWINPYGLKFTADPSFKSDTKFTIEMKPDNFLLDGQNLSGETSFTVQTGSFTVTETTMQTEPVTGPGKNVRIEGAITFSSYVNPEKTLAKISLTGSDGKDIPLSITTNYDDYYQRFVSGPIEKTTASKTYTLKISKGLPDGKGNMELSKDYNKSIDIVFDPVLRYMGYNGASTVTGSRVELGFSSPVIPAQLLEMISIKPDVFVSAASSGKKVVLSGPFVPGKKYDITLKEGLTASDGAVLDEGLIANVTIPNITPVADFTANGMFLSESGYKTLGIETVNTNHVDINVDRVFPNNLFSLFTHYGYMAFDSTTYGGGLSPALGNKIFSGKINITSKPNEKTVTPLSLQSFIAEGGKGLYRVSAGVPRQNQKAQRWIMITDLGVVAKQGENESLFWVSSVSTLKPVTDARVQIISNRNQIMASGTTSKRGLLIIKKSALRQDVGRPYMVIVKRKNDMTFLLLDRFATDMAGLDVAGQRLSPKGFTSFSYGERNLYRPGETVKGVAIIRDKKLTPSNKMPIVLVYTDQRGRELFRKTATTDSQGMVEFKREIPDYSPTGHFSVKILAGNENIGNYRYSVEDFMPDRIAAEIITAEIPELGENLKFEVEGRYLFGPPAESLPVTARVSLESANFAPKGYENYRFNTDSSSFKPREIMVSDEKLDGSGKHSFSVIIPDNIKSDSALQARLTARISETGGRGVTATKTEPINISKFYPGLKSPAKQGYEQNEAVKVDYVTLTPEGEKTVAPNLTMTLYRDRWQTIVRATPSGGFKYVTERDPQLIETRKISPADPLGSFKVSPAEFGSYRVILSDPESGVSAQANFFCGGWGYSPWAMKNPSRLEIVPVKKGDYKPGEMAEYQIRAPFAGKMLITIEDRSIRWSKTLSIKGNTAKISVPVQKGLSPNAYVTATLIRSVNDIEAGSSARAVGAVPLFVNRNSNKLSVAIQSPETIRPMQTVTIKVKTDPGAKLTIAAVDEGILRLSGQKTADPFSYFYAKRALGVRWSDTFGMLMPDAGPINSSPAGGGASLAMMKQFAGSASIKRVKPVTFWSGIITADKKGNASFDAKIPSFSGALRIMAVVTDGKKFGSSSTLMTVRSPLMVTPTLPRFLAPNESFDIPVAVRNDTPEHGNFTITVKASGAFETAMSLDSFAVEKNRQQTAFFKAKTSNSIGESVFEFTAEGNKEKTQESIDMVIRPAIPVQRASRSGFLKDKKTSFPLTLKGMRNATISRTLTIGNQPMIRMAGKLDYLLRYPYGCAEQTISRAFPLLKFPELARELSPSSFDEKSPQYMVQSALSRLAMMQSGNGGFAMWPGSYKPDAWTSVYALHFLYEASLSGYQVDSLLKNSAIAYVSSIASQINDQKSFRLPCYALYVLAKCGKPMHGPMNYVREQKTSKLDQLSLTLLGGAFAATGDMAAYTKLLATKPIPSSDADKDNFFSSETRDLALETLVRMEFDKADDSIPKMIKKLSNLMADSGRNITQDNALGFMALGSFFGQTKSAPMPAGKITSGAKELAVFDKNSTTVVTLKGDAKFDIELASAPKEGTAVWTITSRAVPEVTNWKPFSNGLEITREFLSRDGEPLDVNKIKQGQLIAMRTTVTSKGKRITNAVIQCLLPSGLEPENTKLATTEDLPWLKKGNVRPDHVDIRDDRVLVFSDIPAKGKVEQVTLLRAVTRGEFKIPPAQVQAMYNPEIAGATDIGEMAIK